jgi:hypothetical protein
VAADGYPVRSTDNHAYGIDPSELQVDSRVGVA